MQRTRTGRLIRRDQQALAEGESSGESKPLEISPIKDEYLDQVESEVLVVRVLV